MRVKVSWSSSRIDIKNPSLADDEQVEIFMQNLRETIADTVRMVMQCHPTYLVMGMSAETFWGGKDGASKFENFMHDLSGLNVTTGAAAAKKALDCFGAKTIGIITPYQPVGDQQVSLS
jgi:maleate isomerase